MDPAELAGIPVAVDFSSYLMPGCSPIDCAFRNIPTPSERRRLPCGSSERRRRWSGMTSSLAMSLLLVSSPVFPAGAACQNQRAQQRQ